MMQDEHLGGPPRRNVFSQAIGRISQLYQRYLDLWTPHVVSRWTVAFFLVFVFSLRILLSEGWYIVTYALAIYHLNLFIAFLTPKIDPGMDFDDGEGPELPTRSNEEFRPFIRRLPEFKFWYSVMKSTIIAMICTMFDCFNVPVFWPILVMYFITLFCITMKRQIKHMIKYRYLPFTYGKPSYQNHEDTSRYKHTHRVRYCVTRFINLDTCMSNTIVGHLISLNNVKWKSLRYVHGVGNIVMPNVLRKRLLIRVHLWKFDDGCRRI